MPLHPSPYSNPPDYVPWVSTGYEYPSTSNIPAADSESAWASLTLTSRNDPSMLPHPDGPDGFDWMGYHTARAPQSQGYHYAPSVNPSPAVSVPETNMWDSNDYNNNSVSPYSDPASMSTGHTPFSQENTSNTTSYFSSAHMPVDSRFSSPSLYQPEASEATTTSPFSTPQHEPALNPPPFYGLHIPDNSEKRKRSTPSTSLAPKPKPAVSKPRKGKSNPTAPSTKTNMMNLALEQKSQDQLVQRFGSSIPAMTNADAKAGLSRGDQIRREAMRICEAEVKEMTERRRQLTENYSEAQERETERLLMNVRSLREAAARNQQQLEEAVTKASGLERGEQ